MNLYFEEIEHKYFCKELPAQKWISVSGLFDMVKPKFDSEAISINYSKKGKNAILQDLAKKWELTIEEAIEKWGHLEFTPEQIRTIWEEKKDKGLARGTAFHKAVEKKLLNRDGIAGNQIEGEYRKSLDLKNLTPGKYIELIIPYPVLFLTGTADRVEIFPNKEFIIRDWKSDNKLEYKGTAYFDPKIKEKKVRKLLPPLNHLDDVNGVHYNVKESLYIYFLESYGYKFKEGWIDHVQFEKDEPVGIVEYPITYLKKEVINLLNWYKLKKK
jgi:hypothetical protein